MKALRNGIVFLSAMVGVICFVLLDLLLKTAYATPLSLAAALLFGLSLTFGMRQYMNHRRRLIPSTELPHLRFQEIANCYHHDSICAGLLLLTEEALVFIQKRKNTQLRTVIPLRQIQEVSTGIVIRKLSGVHITKRDHSVISFVTPEYPKLLHALRSALEEI